MDEEITVDEAYLVSLRDTLISDVEKLFTIFDNYNELRLKLNKSKLDDDFLEIERTEFQDYDVLKYNKPLTFRRRVRIQIKTLLDELEASLKQSITSDLEETELTIQLLNEMNLLIGGLKYRSEEFSRACDYFMVRNPKLLDKAYLESRGEEELYLNDHLLYDEKKWLYRDGCDDFFTIGHIDEMSIEQAKATVKLFEKIINMTEEDEDDDGGWENIEELYCVYSRIVDYGQSYVEDTIHKLKKLAHNIEELKKL